MNNNSAIGYEALRAMNTTGHMNVALGVDPSRFLPPTIQSEVRKLLQEKDHVRV